MRLNKIPHISIPVEFFLGKIIRDKIRGVKNTSNNGMIKVSGIIHKRVKQNDTRIAWMMLQNIYLMNGDINNK